MANALASLQDATTGEVTAKIAALKTSTKEIIDAQSRDHTKNVLTKQTKPACNFFS